MKIRTRLFLAFLVLVGLGFYLLVDWIIDDLQPRYLETMEESMVDTATVLASLLSSQIADGPLRTDRLRTALDEAKRRTFAASIYDMVKTNLNARVYVTDSQGMVVFDSDGGKDEGKNYAQWNDVYRTLRGEYGARTTRINANDPRTAVLYVAAPVKIADGIVGVLTVCKPASSVTLFLHAAKRKIVIASALAAGSVALLGIITSFWITSPIQKLTDYAMAVRDGRRRPAPTLGRSEIGALGAAFEQMRDSLEGKQYVENYVQTLTHEMKSPLSAIRGAAELMEEDMPADKRRLFLKNIRTESDRIRDFVDRLLQLSALESRKQLRDIEDINVAGLAKDVMGSLAPLAEAKTITFRAELDESAIVKGERFAVRQALANLLQNAIAFSPVGQEIVVSVSRAGRFVEMAVRDRGPGVPDYALPRIFDRFYSLRHPDSGLKGTGLGLTFVREAALLHGGEARVENAPGGGVRAAVTLPLKT